MKNKFKHKLHLHKRKKKFNDTLNVLIEYMDSNYPGWKNTKDAGHIKKRLNQAARKMTSNSFIKKTKVLKKSDFKDWPFTSDSIILVQTSKRMISCIIDFQEYALNGLAESGLNLKFPHDCEKAIKGKSVDEFIKIGLEL
jgi:hypothetical protein